MYCLLLTAFYDPQNNNFRNFRLGQITESHYILGGRGIGEGVLENNAYCFLLRMAPSFFFIYNGGIWTVPYSLDLKIVLIFVVTALRAEANRS